MVSTLLDIDVMIWILGILVISIGLGYFLDRRLQRRNQKDIEE